MKTKITTLLLFASATLLCQAQTVTSGLIPKTPTFYVNTNYYNNAGGESPAIDIAANGNVLIGWEDDGSGAYDFESTWSVFSPNGVLLTPQTVITSYVYGVTITNTFLSYFRSDGSATPAFTGFGPKIKANRFGNGMGHGSSTDALGAEVPELAAINEDDGGPIGSGAGGFPSVQLLNNDGSPIRILTGGTDADLQPAGSVRIGDWDYLASGNVVIVGESRQAVDRALTGQAAGNVPVYRIVTPAGAQVKGYTPVSSEPISGDIWHGVGVTANGFAVRFNGGSGAGITVRMFDNAGNPTTSNINLTPLTGQNQGGNRGDASGFHGNGKDAYVNCNTVSYLGVNTPWLTVLNANGTLRWSRAVADTNDTFVANRVDAAIATDGRVIAVWDSALPNASPNGVTNRLIQARLFSATGVPLGGRFVVSEWENPANPATVYTSEIPRVAWRNDTIAIMWLSQNAPTVVNDPVSPGAAEVIAAALFKVTPLITDVVETGGDNEPTDTITAKWTGQTFPVSVAGEPLPGLVVGSNYTVGSFGNGAPVFVDRNGIYTNASGTVFIPSYLAGGEYIMSGNDNRDNATLTMDVTVSQPVQAYLLIDNRLSDGNAADPPTFGSTSMQWVLDQGWAAVRTGNNRTANINVPDEVGIDEGADGSINNWYSIYTKAFPAGTFQLKQADNSGRNMYGAVITLPPLVALQPPRLTIAQQGANVVITFPAGYRLQRATSVNGPWADVSGTSPVTEPASAARQYYRGISP